MFMISIAIDGPAGAGKSTIAKKIASKLSFIYVDTGAMYRAIALHCIRNQVNPTDENSINQLCQEALVTIIYQSGEQLVLLNGENVNAYIRTEEVGKMASTISVYKAVRNKLVELQRELAKSANVIMDGRDIGTFVLPDASVKIYLTAGSRKRAERRYQELTEKGIECHLAEIENDIILRDERDMNREFAPLKQADDAVLVDSSEMTIEEVVETIIRICTDKVKL